MNKDKRKPIRFIYSINLQLAASLVVAIITIIRPKLTMGTQDWWA
jgi:hypothetical protein